MSRADAAARIVDAAIALGSRLGVAALSLQGIATESGVSKALVLYHHHGKDELLLAVAEQLVAREVEALTRAATDPDLLAAWQRVAGDEIRRAERALLAALLAERELRPQAGAFHARRAQAAGTLAQALFASAGLQSRIASSLLGRVALAQLDGIAMGPRERSAAVIEAELDATALALMGLAK